MNAELDPEPEHELGDVDFFVYWQMYSPENIQLLSNDERSSAINPHVPAHIQKRNSEEKIALNVRPYSGSAIKETAAEHNFRSTKKSGQTPPQANAPDHGSRKKRQFNCNYLLACNFSLSPHLWPMAEFFPNHGGIFHPVNYRG
ncbi:hypothetical protein Ddc_15200 [Ditylenchus destructor]|nr:hypothetical protein Ddc_15200 [Ditylenchus destructor]